MSRAPHNVGSWPAERARATPDRLAIRDEDRSLDFASLEARCQQAAGFLAELGVTRGDRVGLLLGNRCATLELLLAAARRGAIAVPLNNRLAPPELAQLLRDCTPRVLFHEHDLDDLARRACDAAPGPTRVAVGGEPDAYQAGLEAARPRPEVLDLDGEAPLILMYTSGTTGVPKGALLPHRKTLFNCRNAELFFEAKPTDRVLAVVPLFHSFGLQILSLPALYVGASLYLQQSFDPARVWRTVEQEAITYLGGVPTMFRALDRELREGGRDPDLGSLRFLFTAGAAIPVELIRAFEERGLVLKQGFGQTETSILCCLEARDAVRKAGTVGRPVHHGDVRIVRQDSLALPTERWQETAVGETGEIVVRGPITMLGYWERPEATAETLRDDWLRTGDLASRDEEGFVTLTGRVRDLYISGGENVYPAQVEAVYEEHEAIAEIAVVGVPDERWGEAGRAYVVPRPDAELDPEELQRFGRERLATFKVPREFVVVDALPRTETGKVQRYALRDESAA